MVIGYYLLYLYYFLNILERDGIQCTGRTFDVSDSGGHSIFRATRDEVHIKAESLGVDGDGGISVQSGVQTPLIRAPPGFDLE